VAHCARCGKKQSIFSSRASGYCGECEGVVKAEVAEQKEKQAKEERLRHEEDVRQKLERLKTGVRQQLEKGGRAYLYETRFIPVDSIEDSVPLSNAFAITHLQAMGLSGWEIVGVVPRTSARTLQNKDLGSGLFTYAGGIGGTVDGVYILLKKEIPADWEKNEQSRREVGQLLAAQAVMPV